MIPKEFALGVPPSRKVIQIAATNPGHEVQYLYDTGEVMVLTWKWNEQTQAYDRVWEEMETP